MASRAASSCGAPASHFHPLYVRINSARLLLLSGWQEGTEPRNPWFAFFPGTPGCSRILRQVTPARCRRCKHPGHLGSDKSGSSASTATPGSDPAGTGCSLSPRPAAPSPKCHLRQRPGPASEAPRALRCPRNDVRYDKGQLAVVANVLTPSQGLHHVVHQRALPKSFYRHKLYSLWFARVRVREISARTKR